MNDHWCPGGCCLYCTVNDVYEKIEQLKRTNYLLASENISLKKEVENMDKKIKEVRKEVNKDAKKEDKKLGKLLKADKKVDKKMIALETKKMNRGC